MIVDITDLRTSCEQIDGKRAQIPRGGYTFVGLHKFIMYVFVEMSLPDRWRYKIRMPSRNPSGHRPTL